MPFHYEICVPRQLFENDLSHEWIRLFLAMGLLQMMNRFEMSLGQHLALVYSQQISCLIEDWEYLRKVLCVSSICRNGFDQIHRQEFSHALSKLQRFDLYQTSAALETQKEIENFKSSNYGNTKSYLDSSIVVFTILCTYLELEKVGLGNNSLSIALDVNKVLILLNADIAFASNPAKSDAVP